jgi:tetratricopeptide (TPR) repeat protein
MRLQATSALAALLVLAGCDRFTPPTSYEAGMKAAGPALTEGKDSLALKICLAAFDFATKAAAGAKAISALECIAEASIRDGSTAKALPAYATVIGTFNKNLMISTGRLRLRNNYGVALYASGKKPEGVIAIEEALDAYAGTEYASSSVGEYPRRMRLVTNLARASLGNPDSAVAARVAGPLAEEIEVRVAQGGDNVGLTMGSAEALAAIAELERKRGKVDHATALAALSAERKAVEDAFAARSPPRKRECDRVAAGTAFYETCFQKIK